MSIKSLDAFIPKQTRTYKSEYANDIKAFLKTGAESAEVAVKEGVLPTSAAVGYLLAIKRHPAFTGKVKALRRGNRVFLQRIEKGEQKNA